MSQNLNPFDFEIDVFDQLDNPQKSQIYLPESPRSVIDQVQPRRQQQSQSVPIVRQKQNKNKKHVNKFSFNDQQKINLSKKLPRGFVLLKKGDLPDMNWNGQFKGQIQYVPIKKQPKIASLELLQKFPITVFGSMNPKKQVEKKFQKPGLRLSSGQLPEGKSKQSQKVKGVLQKFRKHPKYPALAQHLTKLGFMQGFNQIQTQIKKNIHTIDSFKNRMIYILNQAKLAIYSDTTIQIINQLIDQFMFQIQQAKKMQFENNLIMIQKNIDKITRQITDIKDSGNWYLRRKKRSQKNFDEKEVMYITDLVRQLPPAYLVGVWQIIQERPFLQSSEKQLVIDFSKLKTKKVREIQSYVKRKHNTYFRSRQRKRQKLNKKKIQKNQEKIQQQIRKQQRQQRKFPQHQMVEKPKSSIQIDNFLSQLDEKKQKSNQKNDLDFFDYQKPRDNFGFSNQSRQQDNFLEQLLIQDDVFADKNQFRMQLQEEKKPIIQNVNQEKKIENIEKESQDNGAGFQMQPLDLGMRERIEGDSSDSSMITDDEDSDY